jgi:hypothetical protein
MHREQVADDQAYGNCNDNYCPVHGGFVFKGRNLRLIVIYLITHYAQVSFCNFWVSLIAGCRYLSAR